MGKTGIYLAAICSALTTAMGLPATAEPLSGGKWHGYVEAGGKYGNDRSIGETLFFLPIAQDNDTLLFSDIRAKIDDDSGKEANIGLGLRDIISDNWLVGGYLFYDRRRSPNGNYFHQGTLGFEALSPDWDLRLNLYRPEGSKKLLSGGTPTAFISGGSFFIRNQETRERALPGFDLEAGYRIPALPFPVRIYGAYFRFDAEDYRRVSGLRFRIQTEIDLADIGAPQGWTLFAGGETQEDDVRGRQNFGFLRLRIPFQSNRGGEDRNGTALSAIERRMTTRIERDVDIVAGEAELAAGAESAFLVNDNGQQVTQFTQVDATGDVDAVVNAGGANSMIVVDGSAGALAADNPMTLQSGQIVYGGGTSVTVRTSGGVQAAVTLPGSAPVINAAGGVADIVRMANSGRLSNLTLDGGNDGVNFNNVASASLSNVTIRNVGEDAIEIQNGGSDLSFRNVTINNAGGGAQDGFQLETGTLTSVSFENVSIDTVSSALVVSPGTTLNNPSGSITTSNFNSNCDNGGTINGSTLTVGGAICQ